MPTLNAKLIKKTPACPDCNLKYTPGTAEDYGTMDEGFYFIFTCPACSDKRRRVRVRFETNNEFKVMKNVS